MGEVINVPYALQDDLNALKARVEQLELELAELHKKCDDGRNESAGSDNK